VDGPGETGAAPSTATTVTPFIGANAQGGTHRGRRRTLCHPGGADQRHHVHVSACRRPTPSGRGPQSTASNPVTPQRGALAACPCHHLRSLLHAGNRRLPATAGGGQPWRGLHRRHRWLHHRHPLLQGGCQRRHPRSGPCGRSRGTGPSPRPRSPASLPSGWQQVTFCQPGADHCGNHLRRPPTLPRLATTPSPPTCSAQRASTVRLSTRWPTPPRPNGVFTYSSTSVFPTSSFNATNYWVDVVFNTKATAGRPRRASVPAPGKRLCHRLVDGRRRTPAAARSRPTRSHPSSAPPPQTATIVTGSPPAVSADGHRAHQRDELHVSRSPHRAPPGRGAAAAVQRGSHTRTCRRRPVRARSSGRPTPATVDSGDNASVVLGVAFNAEVSGFGDRRPVLQGPRPTRAPMFGALWSASGQLLASATFAG